MSMYFNSYDQVINLKVKITTLLDQNITGLIYTYSTSNNVLVLKITENSHNKNSHSNNNNNNNNENTTNDNNNNNNNNNKSCYRIINTAYIKKIQVVSSIKKNAQQLVQQHLQNDPSKRDQIKIHPIAINDLENTIKEAISNHKISAHKSSNQVSGNTASSNVSPNSVAHSTSGSPTRERRASKTSSIATKVYNKFVKKYGEENVTWSGGSHNIIIFNEVKLTKPYTLGNKSIHKLSKSNSKHFEEIQDTLKEFWLEVDNEKRGG
ncbi:uncharacterized protein RJT21DRAFT_33584 [Scheffersomyces amazonensis]|uniref:uncharacterized protein n=1 Tax=Scheffersomyces amazonensis TaxID=1078765 RepID=UPI00315DB67D